MTGILAQIVVALNALANAVGRPALSPVASMPGWLQAFAKISPVTVTADDQESTAPVRVPGRAEGRLLGGNLTLLATSAGTYCSGQASDAGWCVAFAGVGAAGWAASRRRMLLDDSGVMNRWQVMLPYLPFGLAACVVVGQTLVGVRVDAPETVPMLAGLMLILLRQLSTLLHNSTLARRLQHQAYHDPLTGLGNRALFTERLESVLARSTPEISAPMIGVSFSTPMVSKGSSSPAVWR